MCYNLQMQTITKQNILHFLKEIKPELKADGITAVGLFGSYATSEQTPTSDIDILVETSDKFVEKYGAWGYFDKLNTIRDTISKHFHAPVDIFDKSSKSTLKQSILKDVIYV